MYDLLGLQVFSVDELRAAGLGFAAQACDGDCGIGLPDEAEHAVDRIAPGRDAADKALEEDHLDIEGDFGQLDEKPCDGGQLVCGVALRPDHAAAAFDLGDLPDLSVASSVPGTSSTASSRAVRNASESCFTAEP